MPTQYNIVLRDQGAQQVALFDTWRSLTYEKRLNNWGAYSLYYYGGDSRRLLFEVDGLLEVRRRNPEYGLDWYTDYIGFHRTAGNSISEADQDIAVSQGRSLVDLLRRRAIEYFAGSAYTNKGPAPADDIMKAFVFENAGAGAIAPPRRNLPTSSAIFPGFGVAANASAGPLWEGQRSWKNLLEVVQEIALASHVDFDVVIDTALALPIEFRTYYPQIGVDRSVDNAANNPPIIFAPEFGNLTTPNYTDSRTEEVTAVLVVGEGESSSRASLERVSAAAAESPFNRIELVRDARNETGDEALEQIALAELEKLGRQQALTFRVLQTDATVYGRDYNVGDTITARFKNIQMNKRIVGVQVNVSAPRGETIDIDVADATPIPANFAEAVSQGLANLSRRIEAIEHSGEI
jgi:hypothetical protein